MCANGLPKTVAAFMDSEATMKDGLYAKEPLINTIIQLAQDFVGSNNLNLLQPIGQFGMRLIGGEDCASARYIYTAFSPLARWIFPRAGDSVLPYIEEGNVRIEPQWGTIKEASEGRFDVSGIVKLRPSRKNAHFIQAEITEFLVDVWTQKYKERALDIFAKNGIISARQLPSYSKVADDEWQAAGIQRRHPQRSSLSNCEWLGR